MLSERMVLQIATRGFPRTDTAFLRTNRGGTLKGVGYAITFAKPRCTDEKVINYYLAPC
jgi:hypothetical protein